MSRGRSAGSSFAMFYDESSVGAASYRVDWIRQFLPSMGLVTVHAAARHAVDVVVKLLSKGELELLVAPVFVAVSS